MAGCVDKQGGDSGESEDSISTDAGGEGGFVEECKASSMPYGQDPAANGSGLEWCEDGDRGALHRPKGVDCPEPEADPICAQAGYDASACGAELDCGAGQRCALTGSDTCECVAACQTDADCEAEEACVCASGSSLHQDDGVYRAGCRPSTCQTDDECGSDALCVASQTCGAIGMFACRGDDACTEAECPSCALTDGQWQCLNPSCE